MVWLRLAAPIAAFAGDEERQPAGLAPPGFSPGGRSLQRRTVRDSYFVSRCKGVLTGSPRAGVWGVLAPAENSCPAPLPARSASGPIALSEGQGCGSIGRIKPR